MKKILFLYSFPWFPIKRQIPDQDSILKEYEFCFENKYDSYDGVVIYNNLPDNYPININYPSNKLVLIVGEPPSRVTLNEEYASQFSKVISCHENLTHPNHQLMHQALPWWVGLERKDKNIFDVNLSYSDLKKMKSIEKSKELSIVCSNLIITPEHRKRVKFVRELAKYFGTRIDIYGEGYNRIIDKWNAVAPYKYHIALENSHENNYWTEKLSDSFLAGSMPIYSGCLNINKYFKASSLIKIDYRKPVNIAIHKIENALKTNVYENNKAEIWSSRNKILDQYNLFTEIINILNTEPSLNIINKTIYPSGSFKNTRKIRHQGYKKLLTESIARALFKIQK